MDTIEEDAPSAFPDRMSTLHASGRCRLSLDQPRTLIDSRKDRVAVGGAAAALLVLVAGGAAVAVASGRGDTSAQQSVEVPGTTTTSAITTASAAAPAPWCPPGVEGDVVRGNGSGGTGSGPDAILGFEHAFYVARDAAKAREYVTPEVAKDQLADLQSGIDLHVPVGTVHCVEVRPTDLPGSFALELTEKRPNGETVRYLQTISTSVRDGRTLIAAITQK
ncbi:hypothetical protein GS883_21750 [Rhodococcus hoagii]|nr:hypothetical protein [Prescottella equi]